MNNRKTLLISIIVLLLSYFIWRKLNNNSGALVNPNKKSIANEVLVGGVTIKIQPIDNTIFTTGSILPNEQVDLKSEINARIVKISFSEGSRVKKGELLVKLFDADLQAQKNKLELQKKLAEEKEFRERNLLQKGAVSQEEYDNILNQLNVLKADLDLLKSQIEKTEIRAPFNGLVGLRYASEGSCAVPAQKIATMVNDEKIKIDFSIPEKYAPYIKKGNSIDFSTKGTSKPCKGIVYATDPQIDPATRSLQVRAIANNVTGFIPGTFVEVSISIDKVSKGLTVPTEAVVPELKGEKVYLYKAGKAISQKIITGLRTDSYVEVIEGIHAGDTVITKGVIKLRNDMPVKITLK